MEAPVETVVLMAVTEDLMAVTAVLMAVTVDLATDPVNILLFLKSALKKF